jgi:5-methylcytosine-specific restriction endonuclease McrA
VEEVQMAYKNKEELAAYAKAYYLANKEKRAEQMKTYRLANREKMVGQTKTWIKTNKEKHSEQKKAWAKANPEKSANHKKTYLLKLNLVNNKVTWRTLSAWAAQVKQRDTSCLYCGSTSNLHAHHILSKSKHPDWALFLDNGITLCKVCHIQEHTINGDI